MRVRFWSIHYVLLCAFVQMAWYCHWLPTFQLALEVGYTFHGGWLQDVPSKWNTTAEVLNDVHGLEDYVAALATHDLQVEHPIYAAAAFDLNHANSIANAQGLDDWNAFMSPGNPAFASTAALPLSWGSLVDATPGSTIQSHLADMSGATAPPTLFLTARLPGGGKK